MNSFFFLLMKRRDSGLPDFSESSVYDISSNPREPKRPRPTDDHFRTSFASSFAGDRFVSPLPSSNCDVLPSFPTPSSPPSSSIPTSLDHSLYHSLLSSSPSNNKPSIPAPRQWSSAVTSASAIQTRLCGTVKGLLGRGEPLRVLDAGGLANDYYVNVLSWSRSENLLAIALGRAVFVWAGESGRSIELVRYPGDSSSPVPVTSLAWLEGVGATLALGMSDGRVELWDCESSRCLRTLGPDSAAIGCCGWGGVVRLLATGTHGGRTELWDVRAPEGRVWGCETHVGRVCGLAWEETGVGRLATGGSDGCVRLWDCRKGEGRNSGPVGVAGGHKGAVRAVGWSGWGAGLLATGGGASDGRVRVWDCNGKEPRICGEAETGKQVLRVEWSPGSRRELITAHGGPDNELVLWHAPGLQRLGIVGTHVRRVLHTAVSPDGSVVASAGAEGLLKFWDVWPQETSQVVNRFSNMSGKKLLDGLRLGSTDTFLRAQKEASEDIQGELDSELDIK